MHPLLLILSAPFVWKFAVDYGKKYYPPKSTAEDTATALTKT